jgi:hypothetical protein
MSGYVIGALIATATTVLGFGLNAWREKGVRRELRRSERQGELQRAMRAYLSALDDLTVEDETSAVVRPRLTRADRWMQERLRGTSIDFLVTIIARLLERAMYGRRRYELNDRLTQASAHLRLVAPPEVEAYMIEGEALGRRHRPGDEQWQKEWREFRSRMRQGFRDALDGLPDDA